MLEVDHVLPRSEGGGDELENLLTACWDCNRGKGATVLDSSVTTLDLEEQTDLIREKERQIREYNLAKREQRERRNNEFAHAWNYWFELWDADTLPRYYTPWESALRDWIDEIGLEEVEDAMDITAARFDYLTKRALAYLAGVCRQKAEARV